MSYSQSVSDSVVKFVDTSIHETSIVEITTGCEVQYTVSGKKGATLFLPVTPRNSNPFSKFFYHHALQ